MIIIRNPAHTRPLSNNVKRLMRESRASPQNPDVVKSGRTLGEKDMAFCDLQGCIFMCAVDRGLDMELFAPLFMNSQLSALIDFSFFHPGCQGPEVEYLKIPLLLKSPELIVDVLLWIEGIVAKKEKDETARAALATAARRRVARPSTRPSPTAAGSLATMTASAWKTASVAPARPLTSSAVLGRLLTRRARRPFVRLRRSPVSASMMMTTSNYLGWLYS